MSIDNTADVIDSRDIIARIEELHGDRAALVADIEAAKEAGEELVNDTENPEPEQAEYASSLAIAERALSDWDASDDASELRALEALAEQCAGYGDWEYGEALINRDHFVTYTQELIDDCYELPKGSKEEKWPFNHMSIDWESAARELEHDYMSVDFDGAEYLMRC